MQKVAITNNQFTDLATKTFNDLIDDQLFTDVTLVTADDKQVKAHKVVLGASSKFFKSVFSKNTDSKLLIYLKDITHKELTWMMYFIYLGQCQLEQTELERFVSVGKDLKVEGIMEEDNINDEIERPNSSMQNVSVTGANLSEKDIQMVDDVAVDDVVVDDVVLDDEGILEVGDHDAYNEDFNGVESSIGLEADHNEIKAEDYNESRYETSDYDANASLVSMNDSLVFKSSYAEVDIAKNEEGLFQCDECKYKTKSKSHIKAHKISVHQKVKYNCDLCEYQATKEKYVNMHKIKIHNWEAM